MLAHLMVYVRPLFYAMWAYIGLRDYHREPVARGQHGVAFSSWNFERVATVAR